MLVIDDRENQKLIHELLLVMGDASQEEKGQAVVKRLPSADYVMGDCGIEAKEINDLYKSIMGIGRTRNITAQLVDLQNSYENPMLVVYGTKLKPYFKYRPTAQQVNKEIAKMKKVIQTFKATFYQKFGKIKYMEVASMSDFVEWLVVNHHTQLLKGKSALPPSIAKKANRYLDPRVEALSGISGITPRMAEDLLKKFGSIGNILKSKTTQKELMTVNGLGRVKAKNILMLRDEWNE